MTPDEQKLYDIQLRYNRAVDLLDACADYLDNYADVIDGDDGISMPNDALYLLSLIRREIGG